MEPPPDRLLTELDEPEPPELLGRDLTVERDPPALLFFTDPLPLFGLTPGLVRFELLDPGRTCPLRALRSAACPLDPEFQIRVPFLRGSTVLRLLPDRRSWVRALGVVPPPDRFDRPMEPLLLPRRGVIPLREVESVERLSAPAAVCVLRALPVPDRVPLLTLPPSRMRNPGFPPACVPGLKLVRVRVAGSWPWKELLPDTAPDEPRRERCVLKNAQSEC